MVILHPLWPAGRQGRIAVRMQVWRGEGLHSNPGCIRFQLCDPGQATKPSWTSGFPSYDRKGSTGTSFVLLSEGSSLGILYTALSTYMGCSHCSRNFTGSSREKRKGEKIKGYHLQFENQGLSGLLPTSREHSAGVWASRAWW